MSDSTEIAESKFPLPLDMATVAAIDTIENHHRKVYEAAKMYVSLGWRVIPIVKNSKIIPPKRYNVSYTHATNKLKVVEKWFHPEEGIFAGWNIGLATGRDEGIAVIDIDINGEKQGDVQFKDLQTKYSTVPLGPTQTTQSGGKHYIYRWEEGFSSSTGKIGTDIDTRGGAEQACKGHIVAWPSLINEKGYSWDIGGPVPPLPPWALPLLNTPAADGRIGGSGTGRGNENVGASDVEETVPLEQVERMLSAIDPDDLGYDDWVQIGMAIHSQHPVEGLDVWDLWSSHGERYKVGECALRWDGFDEAGTVRMASLFWHANLAGYVPKKDDKKVNKFAGAVERINKTYALVIVGSSARIVKESKNYVAEESTQPFHLLNRSDFLLVLENDRILVDVEKMKYAQTANVWLSDSQRREYLGGLGMFPEGAPSDVYNTWQGFSVKPVAGDCSLFKQHILKVVCSGNKKYYNFVLDWCADLFQHPEDPKWVAIVMRGVEGAGKGIFANTIGKMCTPHYTHLIDQNHLVGNFNSHLADSIFVYADEITWGGNVKSAGKLKGLVTEREMLLERKGIDAVMHRNLVHMMIASNSEWVVPAGTESRRWFILDVNDTKRGDAEYFKLIGNELDGGGKAAFLHEMLDRKITANLREALVTDALIETRQLSNHSTVMLWFCHRLSIGECSGTTDEGKAYWRKKAAFNDYLQYCKDHRLPINNCAKSSNALSTSLNRELKRQDIPQIDTTMRVVVEGAREKVYGLEAPSKYIKALGIHSSIDDLEEGWIVKEFF